MNLPVYGRLILAGTELRHEVSDLTGRVLIEIPRHIDVFVVRDGVDGLFGAHRELLLPLLRA